MQVACMDGDDVNDDEPSFLHIAVAAANVLAFLIKEQRNDQTEQDDRAGNGCAGACKDQSG